MNMMNNTITNIIVSFLAICCLSITTSDAQDSAFYEFECVYLDNTFICPIQWSGDSVQMISNLFNEITISDEVVFTFRDSCVYLTIDGQKGLFYGGTEMGSWNNGENEEERFTIKWDTLVCPNSGELLFKFEFIPYYRENNPYIADDGSTIIREFNDMISYYWTYSAGVVAMEGEWLFVRKDKESLRQCLYCFH